MARRLKSRATEPRPPTPTPAELALSAFVGPVKKGRKKSPGSHRKAHIEQVTDMVKHRDYADMTPGRLVALYWLCHERVYGVAPTELNTAAAWNRAMKSAGKMVAEHFDGDVQRAVVFMRWVWNDERRKEEWRRANKRNGRRITWQGQFVRDYLITDWRASVMRARGG